MLMDMSIVWLIVFAALYLLMSKKGISCMPRFRRNNADGQKEWVSSLCCLTPLEEQKLTQQALPSGVVVLMFTDLEGFTSYVDKHGDDVAYNLLKQHQNIIENTVQRFDGFLVKTIGDGTLVSFASAKNALKCAAEIQQTLIDIDFPLRLRIGLHAGEPSQNEERDLIGHTVNITERVMSQASGNQIYVTDVVKSLAGEVEGFQFHEQGEHRLKGISAPQRIYEFHVIPALSYTLDSVVDKKLLELEQTIQFGKTK